MATVTHDWEIRFSQSRQRPYFYSTLLKKSCWDPPPELTSEEIQKLPGSNLLHESVGGGGGGGDGSDHIGKVRASHILVKHAQSRRPSSWKEASITRTKAEAIEILKGYEEQLKEVKDETTKLIERFGELANQHSDCSSHSALGDLGFFSKGQMQKPFEDATFSLNVNQLSSIVDTDSGVHLILRTA